MGWKDWQIGEVVTESDFQALVQDQVIQVYADSTERSTALGTAVADGMASYLTSTDSLEVYDGSSWVAVNSGGATYTADRAIISDGSGNLAASVVTSTEISYLDGVSSAIQTQLNGKVSTTNGTVSTAATGSTVVRNITLSTATPTGGSDGDVWLVYTA